MDRNINTALSSWAERQRERERKREGKSGAVSMVSSIVFQNGG